MSVLGRIFSFIYPFYFSISILIVEESFLLTYCRFPLQSSPINPTIGAIVTRRRWSSGHNRDPQKPHISHWILGAYSACLYGGKISLYLQVPLYASVFRHWRHYVFGLSVRPPTRSPIDRPTDGLSIHPPRVFPGENVKEMIWNSLCWCNFTTFSTG